MHTVREHDPHSYWAGRFLLPTRHNNSSSSSLRTAHWAVRSFWLETGLRLGSTAQVPVNSTPTVHLDFWQQGIDAVFHPSDEEDQGTTIVGTSSTSPDMTHPTLLLLRHLKREQQLQWTKCHFDDLIQGRRNDLHTTQYNSLDQLTQHAEQTCGSVTQLLLESGGLTMEQNPVAHQAARFVGRAHGLTMQLRQSIPILSTQGRLTIPADLTAKHGVRSPRYLLSALGLGDETCRQALAYAVQDVAEAAFHNLHQARALRDEVLREPHGTTAVAVLLTGHTMPSQAFLERLRNHQYQLTDRNLRSVGIQEQVAIVTRIIAAYYQNMY